MKREIKFRAWDNIRHKMSENVEHGIDLGIWIDFGTMIDSKTDMIDFDIMQFTGLLDKNGKEIWEGDIISESIYDIPAVYCGEEISVVVFRYSAFRKVPLNRYATMNVVDKYGEVYMGDVLELHGNAVRIGNIYENPELLNQ